MCIDPCKCSFAWKQNPGSAMSGLLPLGEPLSWAGHFHTQLPCSFLERACSNKEVWCILPKQEWIQGLEHCGGLAFSLLTLGSVM